MKKESLQSKLESLGLQFVPVDSPTQVMTVVDGDKLIEVSGGAGTGGGGAVTAPARGRAQPYKA